MIKKILSLLLSLLKQCKFNKEICKSLLTKIKSENFFFINSSQPRQNYLVNQWTPWDLGSFYDKHMSKKENIYFL